MSEEGNFQVKLDILQEAIYEAVIIALTDFYSGKVVEASGRFKDEEEELDEEYNDLKVIYDLDIGEVADFVSNVTDVEKIDKLIEIEENHPKIEGGRDTVLISLKVRKEELE